MSDELRARILDAAAQREGMPYRLDPPPNGVDNIDCSLYVIVTYRDAGCPFAPSVRTAEQIRQACIPIGWADVKPGDLLFFEHTYEPGGQPGPDGRIASHVGISLGAGTRRMWNAVESQVSGVSGVQITYLSDEYWQPRLFEARRHPGLDAPAAALTTGYWYLALPRDGLNLRDAPSTTANVLDLIRVGTLLQATGQASIDADGYRWLHVRTPGMLGGYVAGQYTRVMPFGAELNPAPEATFSLEELWPAVQAASAYYGADAHVVMGICRQESWDPAAQQMRNWRVHADGTGHGLFGLDDSGGWQQLQSWLGVERGSFGWGASAIVLPPGIQIEFTADLIARMTASYGDAYTATRVWHRGPTYGTDPDDWRAANYEALIRGHVAKLFG